MKNEFADSSLRFKIFYVVFILTGFALFAFLIALVGTIGTIPALIAPFAGVFRPEGSLSLVDGGNVIGTWTLEISDDTKRNTGTLNSWAMTVTSGSVVGASTAFDPSVVLTANGDAASVMYLDQVLPTYFEIQATINAGKPLAGTKSNAYLVFDYQSETDFKFAGVNISTDKAADPTSVLGWSKRITERQTSHAAAQGRHFVSVRFGNVLGSRGSVLEIFEAQIRDGGPITVTHPEIGRAHV